MSKMAGVGPGQRGGPSSKNSKEADPILLSLFANRFISVAEAMGRSLQQTSISTNIKERLDFSCALFSPDGSLVANAPHLPVHLGSMSFAVRYQIAHLAQANGGDGIQRGDVILANHPAAGGSHLPDMTCITPVFAEDRDEVIFFTASRGHHADIGGILPGSMPPTSKTLYEEGAQIKSFKIVSQGEYDRHGLIKHMLEDPSKYPGCSGSRCIRDVESDLQAQIAANQKGINLIQMLVEEWGLGTVQEYMLHIRNNAELAVRNLLRDVSKRQGTNSLHAIEYMDDGTPIELRVTIDPSAGSAIFDFEGTGPEVQGNWNCPKSVSHSAIIYCLRSMVSMDIPLNQGCLTPIEVRIPKGSLLDPSDSAAVVGGNVLTSQRITDVVLKAFKAVAASQGCTNNLTFGLGGRDKDGNHVEGFGYYETIAGGSGAGPSWHGTSGVHTHMTNTRITDPEIMERRYPVMIRQFSLRTGSGGDGLYRGGDGVIREIEFHSPSIQVSILSERRVYRPFGLEGGEDAKTGLNLWVKQRREEDGDLLDDDEDRDDDGVGVDASASAGDGGQSDGTAKRRKQEKVMDENGKVRQPPRIINLGAKTTARMGRGDRIIIHTPGGGGWGKKSERQQASPSTFDRNAGDKKGAEVEKEEFERGKAMSGRTASLDRAHFENGLHTTHSKGSMMEWEAAQLGA
ncbi:Hydantoinase B/oxoprolinase [Tilletiaria anomala UBC 951]|uniref:Hydantoinase B/oxoprolinase n=1 Tax=Tilletiaria anomala (strain ATCC 24038 / CBS 436.72 / UBC 951) TaxID=1037660 RepID=A0A066WPT2_TILAU|nr:Hydantoinase B/oxoprolinase [Tilletiaria anomala UBC 951]KDN53009.1 Hydantoinase B/oxoprolinase [Tilletiaria anomala UBC 951]